MAAVVHQDLEAAVRAAWALDTCDPVDAADWSAANPSRGQCGSTALVIHDLLGGDLVIAEVIRGDGSRQGVHYWNLLPDGSELDLTREQFADDEAIQQPRVLRRPAGPPGRCAEQYRTMRHRVFDALGITEDDARGTCSHLCTHEDRAGRRRPKVTRASAPASGSLSQAGRCGRIRGCLT